MLEFKPISIREGDFLRPYFRQTPSRQLIDCFEAFYLWRDVFAIEWARWEGFILLKVHYEAGVPEFLYPFGVEDTGSAFRALKAYCREQGYPLRLAKVSDAQLRELQLLFPGELIACSHRDYAEYIFLADTFRTYKGKNLQPKRNFVNYARKNYNWFYEEISGANLQECRHFTENFKGEGTLEEDNEALKNALGDYLLLEMSGGLIRIDGEISALFICTMLGDGETAAGLFLRGDHNKKGVIPLLYQEYFLRHLEFKYFNFGEDLGVDGLRKNKLSFDPEELLELYEVSFLE